MYQIIGKEARKKELKKNKKQRMIVRTAVLKGKDPLQILAEMEKIDQMGKIKFDCTILIKCMNIHLYCLKIMVWYIINVKL